jgi:PKD repeat protein
MKIISGSNTIRLVLALAGILVLTVTSARGAVPDPNLQAAAPTPPSLLRVAVHHPGDLERIAAIADGGLPVYAHLVEQGGQEFLLLPADAARQQALSGLGLAYQILDREISSESYYLLSADSAALLQQAEENTQILTQEGLSTLVKATPMHAERLASSGVEIVRLQLHPLVIPDQYTADLPQVIEPDPTIQGMIDQVSSSTLYSYNAGLSGELPVTIGGQPYTLLTRSSRTIEPIQKATQYVYEHFESLGLPTTYFTYTLPGSGARRNVIAEQTGIEQPDSIYLIAAHLDSTSQDPYNLAPGADDNASGSTGVLVAADILSQYELDCTVRYALFTGEEQGLYGSYAYAQSAYNNGDNIQAVLNLDMIGYNSDSSPEIELHTRYSSPGDQAIASLFAEVVDAYNLDLVPQLVPDGITASDHYSFWQFGYPGILAIEDMQDFNPYYHTTADQVEALDLQYFTEFVKATVGTLAHMGCLQNKGSLAGTVTDSESGSPIPGTSISAQRAAAQTFSTTSELDGTYQLELVEGSYDVTAVADGYESYSASGVDITKGVTTTLDIALDPCRLQDADFTYAPAEPLSGMPVVFTGTASTNSSTPVSYRWDFGDGHTGSGRVASHTYTISDTYTVSMSAENCAGTLHTSQQVMVTGSLGLSASLDSLEVEALVGQVITQTLEIGNSGVMALTWNLTEQPDSPWLDESPVAGSLGPQLREEITLTVQAPVVLGTYTTTLVLQSSDPINPQMDIPVTLKAVSPHTAYLPVLLAAFP